jgi:ABC-type Zn uptake system ZnuABC Zn-binding protein ZnuA
VFALVALARAGAVRRRARRVASVAAAGLAALVAGGCGTGATSGHDGRVAVVATTTQLGDFAREVGGEDADVTQILHPNTDPHEYEPRPKDVRETASARVILTSGDGLDDWMGDIVDQSGADAPVVDVASRLRIRAPGDGTRVDPHWWHDPRNAEQAVRVIRDALVRADPRRRGLFTRNAARYLAQVRALDTRLQRCFAAVPRAQRRLVTDHDAFTYFARRYGITVVGAVIPSQTTQGQPSAGDVADLVRTIRRQRVRAVFPEHAVNQGLAKTIARETGATSRYALYGDTLGDAGSRGATYLGMEQANADAMVRGFTGGARGCGGAA